MDILSIYPDKDEALDVLRHSAAHLLAHAVLDLFPGTRTGVGPAVENGLRPFRAWDTDLLAPWTYNMKKRPLRFTRRMQTDGDRQSSCCHSQI